MALQAWQGAAFSLVVLWILFAIFHYYLIPGLDWRDHELRKIISFITSVKKADQDASFALPIVNVITPESPSSEMTWRAWAFAADFIVVGYYDPGSGRIVLLRGCRQNILVHELAHYVQCEYFSQGSAKGAMNDKEAWDITRLYFQSFHPYRYRFFMALTFGGVFDWWTSMPY